jgi:MSHA pilin protein MshD
MVHVANARQSGVTLVELIVTMMLISIAVLALSNTLTFAFSHQSDGLFQVKSSTLALSYIEEISARRYDENTPVGGVPPCSPATVACSTPGSDGETRAQFDDIDDYDGLDEIPPVDALGNLLDGYDGYRVEISVGYADAAQIAAFNLNDATDAKLITVTVTPPGDSPLSFPMLRANF